MKGIQTPSLDKPQVFPSPMTMLDIRHWIGAIVLACNILFCLLLFGTYCKIPPLFSLSFQIDSGCLFASRSPGAGVVVHV
jgi:hypothetical protein